MSFDNVAPFANAPEMFIFTIEIPIDADPVKYDVDHDTPLSYTHLDVDERQVVVRLSQICPTRSASFTSCPYGLRSPGW